MKNIAVILARSGSKGLQHKNIRPINGVPMMAYTIRAALDSGMFEHVMVSTDSEEYANIAKQWGAEVPFMRSAETSADNSSSWDAVREVLNRYEEMGETFDTVTLLQVTSPMRRGEHIVEAFKLLEEKNANAVISINELPMPVENCKHVPEDMRMDSWYNPDPTYRPRQSFKTAYRCNGAIYIYRTDAFARQTSILEKDCFGYAMDKVHSTDVDDLDDFLIVESLIKNLPEFENYFD